MHLHCCLLGRSLQLVRTVPSCIKCFYSTVSKINESNLVKLNDMQKEISEGILFRDDSYIKVVSSQVMSVLCNGLQSSDGDLQAAAMIMRTIARNSPLTLNSHQELFDSVSEMLLRTQDEIVLRVFLPSFLMACKSLRYYNSPLMTHTSKYVIDNLSNFTQSELSVIVHAYAKLNHHLPHLISEVEGLVVAKNLRTANSHLLWNLAWCGMVFSEYPKEVLTHILTEDYIEGGLSTYYGDLVLIGCSGSMFDDFFAILFQLKLSLNKECPDLRMCLGPDNEGDKEQWGMCRSGLKDISNRMLRRCYMIKLRQYYTRGRSTFGMKVHAAINSTLGASKYVQFDALSLTGYILDFEVLLDGGNVPIPIPEVWRHRNSQTLAASIGEPTPKWMKVEGRVPQDLVEAMRQTEEAECNGGMKELDKETQFPVPEHGHNVGLTSLASDWGAKFAKVPASVARKLVIEANGPSHYAGNCDHPLGSTVLKMRHLQYLGWEVLNVNYKEWMHLESSEAKEKFIGSMIHETRHQTL